MILDKIIIHDNIGGAVFRLLWCKIFTILVSFVLVLEIYLATSDFIKVTDLANCIFLSENTNCKHSPYSTNAMNFKIVIFLFLKILNIVEISLTVRSWFV